MVATELTLGLVVIHVLSPFLLMHIPFYNLAKINLCL